MLCYMLCYRNYWALATSVGVDKSKEYNLRTTFCNGKYDHRPTVYVWKRC